MSGAVGTASSPFTRRGVLFLVLFGAAAFLSLIWMIGNGDGSREDNDGGAHVGGMGLTGFSALASLLEKQGYAVQRSRNEGAFARPGLLVLTPPQFVSAEEISKAIGKHRAEGPTLLVLPKWMAFQVPPLLKNKLKPKPGWVLLDGADAPMWANDIDPLGDLDVLQSKADAAGSGWSGLGYSGRFPDPKHVQPMFGDSIIPLVSDGVDRPLVGYLDDGTANTDLSEAAGVPFDEDEFEEYEYPLIVVSEPDLLNNYGLSGKDRALFALALVRLMDESEDGGRMPVTFDMTLNGLGRTSNLLTLAFTPPFLAATLCLLMAAFVIGWRAFLRFGPPTTGERALAFGKAALVSNAAGLVRRARRLHLLGPPYVDRARDRLVGALALPRGLDHAKTDEAIDRALKARNADAEPFTAIATRLQKARAPHELIKAARELHALERMLVR